MKNTIKLDHENRRIVMDKTFAKLSADVRNEEYDILQRVRRDYPTYEVANRKIKKNPSKQSYKGLTYENMRNYVKDHSGAVSFEYKCLEEMIRASERNDMHYIPSNHTLRYLINLSDIQLIIAPSFKEAQRVLVALQCLCSELSASAINHELINLIFDA